MDGDLLFGLVVVTALAFDFTNGFHDTANVVATSISTRALPPRVAVGFAAVLNFVGAFLSLAVAATVAGGIVAGREEQHLPLCLVCLQLLLSDADAFWRPLRERRDLRG